MRSGWILSMGVAGDGSRGNSRRAGDRSGRERDLIDLKMAGNSNYSNEVISGEV